MGTSPNNTTGGDWAYEVAKDIRLKWMQTAFMQGTDMALPAGHLSDMAEALRSAHHSGKLVASTGSEDETKGADWQPIATAPRTFQPILLDLGRGKHGDIARAPVIGVWSDFCGGWAFWGAPKVPVSPQPIRWHVLPSPHEAPSDAPSSTEAE